VELSLELVDGRGVERRLLGKLVEPRLVGSELKVSERINGVRYFYCRFISQNVPDTFNSPL
jgi:hypothetical protein